MSDRSKSPTGNESEELEQQLGGLALLGDRVRRAIYLHVVSSSGEVSRDDAAGAVGVSRSVASFHLFEKHFLRLKDVLAPRTA